MIHVNELPDLSPGLTMHEYLHDVTGIKDKMLRAVDVVKLMPINGCITGSVWLPGFDPEMWSCQPDVDVFVYSEHDLTTAIDYALYQLKMKPGTGTERSERQEQWKLNRLRMNGLNYKIGITTYKFYCDGVIINFTYKMLKHHGRWIPIVNATSVLQSFDMSIVMQAYDIQSRVMYDMRPDDVSVMTAIPNPTRNQDCVMWTVSKWVRQFDRVVKYWNRGFDTRPVAEFYLEMIDKCIEAGCLFDSDESHEAFDTFADEFLQKRAVIADWLEEHMED